MLEFNNKPIFGMIHLSGDNIIKRAITEIDIFYEENLDGCIIENYHGSVLDVKEVLNLIQIVQSVIPSDKKKLKIGVNILPNEYKSAFEIANYYNADFIQLDFVAGKYYNNKEINETDYLSIKNKYPNISVLGGVWPKYYEPIRGSVLSDDINDGLNRAEAIVVTGLGTGKETPLDKIKEFKTLCGNKPLIIGAGLNSTNVKEQLSIADGAIVGSCFKPYGRTTEPISRELVKEFMDEVNKIK